MSGSRGAGRRASRLAIVFIAAAALTGAGACRRRDPDLVTASGAITTTADDLRTGWYPNQPLLDPALVASAAFGRLWRTALPLSPGEQIYAQPLVSNGTVLIVTEANDAYALSADTGAVLASRSFGTPFRPADVMCGDLAPTVGMTGTPVIDDQTQTAYFFSKRYLVDSASTDPTNVAWFAHAVDVATLAERPGFPVQIQGYAANAPAIPFDPFYEMQRPGLLMMNGVVYAAFGGHCDRGGFRGWIVAIGTDGRIKTLFTTLSVAGAFGAGIWQSGAGLVSDGDGRIFFATGNQYPPLGPDVPQAAPVNNLGESVSRVEVQADGSLVATDFFVPYNRVTLDGADQDFGSGGPVALPAPYFGTAATPKLMVAAGKAGLLYLLDRDHLGGYKQGSGGGDAVVATVNVGAPFWSRPAVWPGDGGYIYPLPANSPLMAFRYGTTSDGKPTFARTGASGEGFGYGSGSPIVTSNGTTSGTALVWLIVSTGSGGGGQLRAYDAVPNAAGVLKLRYADTFGAPSKYAVPGVGDGRLYVGSGDGNVTAYGASSNKVLSGPPADFGTVLVGASSAQAVTITASGSAMVTGLSIPPGTGFTAGTPSPSLPATLGAGATMTVPVTFAPRAAGLSVASLNVVTTAGPAVVSLRGTGQPPSALLVVSPMTVSFGGIKRGTSIGAGVVLTNSGSAPLAWNSFTPPAGPFQVDAFPPLNSALAPGASVTVNLRFAPASAGAFGSSFGVDSSGGAQTVLLTGSAGEPPQLSIAPASLSFRTVAGTVQQQSFTVSNTGGGDLTITKSKPPAQGIFTADSALGEGTTLRPGEARIETVDFAPPAAGSYSDGWIITANDESGVQIITFSGIADPLPGPPARDAGPPDTGGWPRDAGAVSDASTDADAPGDAGEADASVDAGPTTGVGTPPPPPPPPPPPGTVTNGLLATYFDQIDMTGNTVTRVDPTVDFDWPDGSPDLRIPPDLFSARWTGFIRSERSETYTFDTISDDGIRLWIGGTLLIDDWTDHAATLDMGSIAMAAGQPYELRVEYYERAGDARVTLFWSSPSTPMQIVPPENLFTGMPPAPVRSLASGAMATRAATTMDGTIGLPSQIAGNGLLATYYDGVELSGDTVTRVEPTVDFNWGDGSPDPALPNDLFSARWTGSIQPDQTQTYTFTAISDDGVRVWIGGQAVIDDWIDHAPTIDTGSIALIAGQPYDIRVEYYERSGGAMVTLFWSGPATSFQVIPRTALFP